MTDNATIVQETAAAPAEPEAIASPAGNVPEPAPSADPVEAGPSDDIERALAEYDAAIQGPTADEILAPHDDSQHEDHLRSVADALHAQDELAQLRQGGELAQRRAEILEMALAERQHTEWLREERSYFDRLAAEVDADLKEFNLPQNYAHDWLMARGVTDPVVRAAFDHRRLNPRAWDDMKRQLGVQIYRQVSTTRIDPEISSDVWAVRHAIRHTARVMPVEPEPELGSLSDTEYKSYVKRRFGYDPL